MPIEAISHYIGSYTNAIPTDTAETVFKSGVYSFALSAILTGNINQALIMGAVAATASLINAMITTPIFKAMLGRDFIRWYENMGRLVVNLALTQVFVSAFTVYRVDLIASAAFTVVLNLFFNGLENRSLNRNSTYLIF